MQKLLKIAWRWASFKHVSWSFPGKLSALSGIMWVIATIRAILQGQTHSHFLLTLSPVILQSRDQNAIGRFRYDAVDFQGRRAQGFSQYELSSPHMVAWFDIAPLSWDVSSVCLKPVPQERRWNSACSGYDTVNIQYSIIVLTITHNFLKSGSPQTNKASVIRDEVSSSHLRVKRKSFTRARRTLRKSGGILLV